MKKNKNGIQKDLCTPVFIAALFIIAKIWKQPKCPSTVEWIKIWYIEWMKICDNLEGWGGGGRDGREAWEGGDTGVPMDDSF